MTHDLRHKSLLVINKLDHLFGWLKALKSDLRHIYNHKITTKMVTHMKSDISVVYYLF